jgi:acyl-coenzyme A thioesterase PaaI-like protein
VSLVEVTDEAGRLVAVTSARCAILPRVQMPSEVVEAGTAIDGTVQTTLPAGTAFGPVDLTLYFLRPVAPDGRELVAQGTVIHRGRRPAGRQVQRSAFSIPGTVARVHGLPRTFP